MAVHDPLVAPEDCPGGKARRVGAGAGLAVRAGKEESAFERCDGYSSCPLTTGYGKLVLAEFDYELKPTPSFPFDTTKERWSMYQLKRWLLPQLYWRGMLRGRA